MELVTSLLPDIDRTVTLMCSQYLLLSVSKSIGQKVHFIFVGDGMKFTLLCYICPACELMLSLFANFQHI